MIVTSRRKFPLQCGSNSLYSSPVIMNCSIEVDPMSAHADRNLLFGILALQVDFLTCEQLIAGMNASALDKGQSLGQILVDQGALLARHRALIEPMIDVHIERHEGDAAQSLASLSTASTSREWFGAIEDQDVQASLRHLRHASSRDRKSTQPWTAGELTLGGTRFRILR